MNLYNDMTQRNTDNSNGGGIRLVAQQYVLPFILITSLFCLWGGARAILDVLNKHYQLILHVSKTQSALIQAVVYMAYFLGAVPAGMLIRRMGTRVGVITGLVLFAVGSFMFMPAVSFSVFEYILAPLFVIGCGLVLLETAANPYVTLLGDPRTSAGRLNIAQSFNGLGCVAGALLGGLFFFGGDGGGQEAAASIAVPYTVLAVMMLVVAACFAFIKLPEVILDDPHHRDDTADGGQRHTLGFAFFFGFAALICYEISEISINTFFINFMTDDGFMTPTQATVALSMGGLLLFMAGRVVGGLLMSRISTERIFLVCAVGTVLMVLLAMLPLGVLSKMALIVCYVFESIMFPTIFALSIRGLGGRDTETASSILMMSVVGGAIGPLAMGWVGDNCGMRAALGVPLATFAVVLAYAIFVRFRRPKV